MSTDTSSRTSAPSSDPGAARRDSSTTADLGDAQGTTGLHNVRRAAVALLALIVLVALSSA